MRVYQGHGDCPKILLAEAHLFDSGLTTWPFYTYGDVRLGTQNQYGADRRVYQ